MLIEELGVDLQFLAKREKFIIQMWVDTLREAGWSHKRIQKTIVPTVEFINEKEFVSP